MRLSHPITAKLPHPAVLAATVVLIVWVIVTHVTQVNPVDFLVYRYAAQAILSGADVYAGNLFGPMMPDGGMPFTYTPFAALALIPTVIFDSRTAYLLWSLLSVGVVAWATNRFTPLWIRRRTLVVTGLTLLLSATTVVTQHVSFGQINLPLMALVLVDLLRKGDGRFSRCIPRGLLVGVAAAIKLTPALFVVYFLITGQWKPALWATVGGLVASVLAFAIAPAISVKFWTDVLWTLNTRVDFSGSGFTSYGNNSLQGILAAIAPGSNMLAVPVVLAAGAVALLLAGRAYRQDRHVDAALIVGLTAPLLSPISWIHHWVYLIPAAVVILFRGTRRLRTVSILMMVFLIPGPGLGELILSGPPVLAPLGWVMREPLAIMSILCIALLAIPPSRSGIQFHTGSRSSRETVRLTN